MSNSGLSATCQEMALLCMNEFLIKCAIGIMMINDDDDNNDLRLAQECYKYEISDTDWIRI